mgnify:CR=1 FL=1
MTKLKVTFINIIDTADLEAMAAVHGWKSEIENPKFNDKEKESEDNPRMIPSKVSKLDFGIMVLAKKTGAILTHEVTYPKADDLSPKALNELKETVYEELKQNFELKIETE